jgi:hypothetical protein
VAGFAVGDIDFQGHAIQIYVERKFVRVVLSFILGFGLCLFNNFSPILKRVDPLLSNDSVNDARC